MKIRVDRFVKKHELKVNGDEKWLDSIYEFFPTPKGNEKPLIQATLNFDKINDDFLRVFGQVEYSPFVDCSRCGVKIPWMVKEQFDYYFQIASQELDDANLIEVSAQELDEYYLVDKALDIEEFLNEKIQLAIPSRTVLSKADKSDECLVCDESLDDSMVYGVSKEDDPTNPFAALKALKDKN